MIRQFLRFAFLPFGGFIACYFVLTWPLVLSWSSAFFCDGGDGPQMVWNIWWVNQAVSSLHQSPWHTQMLHWPHGVTLLLHSLSPFNGLAGVFLLRVLSLAQTYNTLIIFAFAASGLTAFWLAYDATKAYWPALAAGFIFTFSAFHFAHAPGHLHQISMQFLPLFVLVWLRLLHSPAVKWALAAAGALFLVLLCDHYQALYCVMVAVLATGWWLVRHRDLRSWAGRRGVMAAATFCAAALVSSGPIVLSTFLASRQEMSGIHNPHQFTPDVLKLFVPAWPWHFNALTAAFWVGNGSYVETSISLGIAALAAASVGFVHRRKTAFNTAGLWLLLAIAFSILALGPTLRVWRFAVTDWMPYRLLEEVFPPLKIAGVPPRMVVVAQLAVAVLAAGGLAALSQARRNVRVLLGWLFVLAMVVEAQPRLQATYQPQVPTWVSVLRDRREPGAVIDLLTMGDSAGLYYQTIHGRPIALGYVSRVPANVEAKSAQIAEQALNGDFAPLKAAGFGFIVAGASRPPLSLPVVYEDRGVRAYRLPDMESKDE